MGASTEWTQFFIIVTGLICMGAGTGFERSLLPRMSVEVFDQHSAATLLNFVSTFGASKAMANIVCGPFADRFGRKSTLIVGFIVGLPVMPYIIVAKSWSGITAVNLMFGVSQGFLGSALIFLMIDLLGPSRRAFAVGFSDATIYVTTALVNILAGKLATDYGYRPVPFYVATAFAVVGLISALPLKDTMDMVKAEQQQREEDEEAALLMEKRQKETYRSLSMDSGAEPDPNLESEEEKMEGDLPMVVLAKLGRNMNFISLCFTGMVMNFKDGFAWGSFPVFFSHVHGLSDGKTDLLVALYPLCWGFVQALTGIMSDMFGRKHFLVWGTASCTISMLLFAFPGMFWGPAMGDSSRHIAVWAVADVMLGLGTALAYPSLQAGAADEAEPVNRGLALGVYRFLRDFGYVVGAVGCGRLTDQVGYEGTYMFVGVVLGTALLSMTLSYTSKKKKKLELQYSESF